MKIIAVEEHFAIPELFDAWAALPGAANDEDGTAHIREGKIGRMQTDLGEERLAAMDEEGVDVQVLSVNSPSVQNLASTDAVVIAREANDRLAAAISAHPDRFAGFATLPTPDPIAAADELIRCVTELDMPAALINGRTGERNIDDPVFADLWAAAADLEVPVYIHPILPLPSVRKAYYQGFSDRFDSTFAAGGYGWHVETGIQLLRLVYSGIFDRHPNLQVIVGHWGEVALFYLERIEILDRAGLGLDRSLREYLTENVYYTPSGIFSHRYLNWALEVVSADRILFSVDYPFLHATAQDGAARRFLEEAALSAPTRDKIAHGNWERLTDRRE